MQLCSNSKRRLACLCIPHSNHWCVQMTKLPFVKMHGLGNCFILMDDRRDELASSYQLPDLARAVCNRNFGIGADGLILVKESQTADFRMQIFNEDGSEPEMCGNGIRCFALFLKEENISLKSSLLIETLAGIIKTELKNLNRVEVDMGQPILINQDIIAQGQTPLMIEAEGLEFTYVSMGNPHAIAFVDTFDLNWKKIGSSVETAPQFPNKTNVEFVRIVDAQTAEMKVWERGCGETMACGTGACAVTVASNLRGKLDRGPVTVKLPGGDLSIEWNEWNHVMMTGDAIRVCEGVYIYN